jgi:hypothetical protein
LKIDIASIDELTSIEQKKDSIITKILKKGKSPKKITKAAIIAEGLNRRLP